MRTWVLLLAALVVAAPARALHVTDRVKINEVCYSPAENPESPFEFIELYNAGSTTAYLDGACISDEGSNGSNEATFQFPGTPISGTTIPLAPGAYMLLVGSATGSTYSGIDFEFFGGSLASDTDDPTVPNLVKTSGTAVDLILGNTGDGITLSSGVTTGNVIPCSEVIDGVSWMGGGPGEVYAMSNTVCSDPASSPGTVKSTNSLNRCPNGKDSNNSAMDFVVGARTPRAPNMCPQVAPVVYNLYYAPCIPLAGQQTGVTAFIKDDNGDQSGVRLFYKLETASVFDSLDMTDALGDTIFFAYLPGQPSQSRVLYYAVARDAFGNTTKSPATAPALTRDYRVGFVPISFIQGLTVSDTCLTSVYYGKAVNVAGAVTHVAREFSDTYFYLQSGTAPNSGIKILVPDGSFVPNLADSVVVAGFVDELFCQTQVQAFPGCATRVGTNRKVRARVLSSVSDILLEQNESMLVTVPGPVPVVTGFDTTQVGPTISFEFKVGSGSNTAWVGDDTFTPDGVGYSIVPQPGEILDAVTGIVSARHATAYDFTSRLRLEPRRDNDVDRNYTDVPGDPRLDAARAFDLRQNQPNPFNPVTRIEFDVPAAGDVRLDVFDARGLLVRQLVARHYPAPARDRVIWDARDDQGRALPSGVYLYKLQAGDRIASRKMLLLK